MKLRTSLFIILSILCAIMAGSSAVPFKNDETRVPLDCKKFCDRAGSAFSNARCYSCRCKEAFDGYLPSTKELSCNDAVTEPITIFSSLDPSHPTTLSEVTTSVATCHNPASLTSACAPGGRLGQLTKGDVHIKWICRRNSFSPDFASADLPFSDVGVIGINQRTGASCWWDDYGGSITKNYFPDLDLTLADDEEVAKYDRVFGGTEGDGCTGCHDSDPFMYSPYLKSTKWRTDSYVTSPYSLVRHSGAVTKVSTKHLVSEEAAACTSCHRIGNRSTCSTWARQSMGISKSYSHEELVRNAIDKTSQNNSVAPGDNWTLAYWMPPRLPGSWELWQQRFGKAKQHIVKCCTEPTASECKWEEMPNP